MAETKVLSHQSKKNTDYYLYPDECVMERTWAAELHPKKRDEKKSIDEAKENADKK